MYWCLPSIPGATRLKNADGWSCLASGEDSLPSIPGATRLKPFHTVGKSQMSPCPQFPGDPVETGAGRTNVRRIHPASIPGATRLKPVGLDECFIRSRLPSFRGDPVETTTGGR